MFRQLRLVLAPPQSPQDASDAKTPFSGFNIEFNEENAPAAVVQNGSVWCVSIFCGGRLMVNSTLTPSSSFCFHSFTYFFSWALKNDFYFVIFLYLHWECVLLISLKCKKKSQMGMWVYLFYQEFIHKFFGWREIWGLCMFFIGFNRLFSDSEAQLL